MECASRPPGHSQASDGVIACSPAVPAKTRTNAMMLTMECLVGPGDNVVIQG